MVSTVVLRILLLSLLVPDIWLARGGDPPKIAAR